MEARLQQQHEKKKKCYSFSITKEEDKVRDALIDQPGTRTSQSVPDVSDSDGHIYTHAT